MAFKKKKRKETRHLLFSSLKIRVSLVRFRLRALVTDGGMVAKTRGLHLLFFVPAVRVSMTRGQNDTRTDSRLA